jgi:hypothetical protein
MGTRNVVRFAAFGLLSAICAAAPVEAGGLSTPLGEVVIENLQVGQTYRLKDLANLTMQVANNSDQSVELQMDIVAPSESELKQAASPIPSVTWLTLGEQLFSIDPGGLAATDIYLTVPDDDAYLGGKYQVMIWSHTIARPGQGMTLAYGLKSRIIFTVDTVRADEATEWSGTGADAGFSMGPSEIQLVDVSTGDVWDVAEQAGVVLTVTNPGTDTRTFHLSSFDPADSDAGLVNGFEPTPDPSYLSFSENEFTLQPGAEKTVRLFVNIPNGANHSGRNYLFMIKAETGNENVTGGVWSRVYASLK